MCLNCFAPIVFKLFAPVYVYVFGPTQTSKNLVNKLAFLLWPPIVLLFFALVYVFVVCLGLVSRLYVFMFLAPYCV